MTRKRIGLVVLAALCAVLAYRGYEEYEQRRQEEAMRQQHAEAMRAVQAERELAQRLPHNDKDMDRVPPKYPRAVSAWQAGDKTFYERILTRGRFDTLVVPFQVQDHAFARDIRSLMTAELALAMTGKSTVPDPYLVARALGDGQRRFDTAEVFRIANALEVKRVVLGYVGHNAKGEMRFTLTYYDRGPKEFLGVHLLPTKAKSGNLVANPRLRSRHFEKLAYSDVDTPIEVFYRQLPAMLEFLGLDASDSNLAQSASVLDVGALPASPKDIGAGDAPLAARDAYYFQLLAALAPASAERLRERLTEKSMLAIRRMSADSPDYRVLTARALMNMGLRPAALQALGTPQSAEEKHLAAMLNGNLPDVQAARPQIPAGVRAVLAALEENAMAGAYGVRTQSASLAQVAPLKLPGEVWQSLAARAMTDWDTWAQHENIFVKALLDREFPLEGSTAQSLLQGASAVGDMVKMQSAADLSVLDHVRRHLAGSAEKSCCEPLAARPGARDYLDLIEAIGTDNLLRRVDFLTATQGRPEDALQFLSRVESVYKDHPQFAVLAAQAQVALARNAQGAEQEGLLRTAYATGFNVWYWEQGQTRAAADALEEVIERTGRYDYGGSENFYANDYPYRAFYPYGHAFPSGVWVDKARVALQNSSYDFTPMDRLEWSLGQVKNRWDDFDQVLKSLEQRFAGHPRRVKMMAQASLRKGDVQASEAQYREGIRAQPDDEGLYAELGKLLFENGEAQKSSDVFLSYPGLKKRGQVHPVGLANYAYKAGSLYWWIGDFKRAIPLYRTAAELSTGSDSSMASLTRLHLIDGDFVGALHGSFERARRYNSPYAYRDYFGLLHAMGQSQQAWEGFKAMVGVDAPQVWESALVGHRREGATEAQIGAWVAQEPMRTAGKRYYRGAAYVLRAGVTDRRPTAELPALIAAAEGLGAEHASRPNPPPGPPKKSPHVYMAEAYRALHEGQFPAARAALQEAAGHYDTKIPAFGHLLPYYAFAAARSNDTAAVEALLENFAPGQRRFDYHLAKTVLAALAGKHDQAIQHANTALYRRLFTDHRPIYPEYEFAEICEWLFEVTREPRYRAIALDWARKNQTLQPWVAWAYAVEAKLATNPQERRRAIAMTYYLDKGSERLSRLPQSEVKAAVKEYASRNPFLRTNSERQKQKA